jgi:iron-sulfur cluster repair protein YtfE (RIC family)
MNPIEELEKEHEEIERELKELETIEKSKRINYPNLIHVFKKLIKIWNEHEEKEDRLFPVLEKEEIKIPVEKMLFDHKELGKFKERIINAINSGDENSVKESLNRDGREIIKKLRKHIDDEESVLYLVTLENFDMRELERVRNSFR